MSAAHTAGELRRVGGMLCDAAFRAPVAFLQDENDNDLPNGRADGDRLALCWNALHGLTNEQVERLGRLLAAHNHDELEIMLTESGV